MDSGKSIITSIIIHAGLAWAAFNVPNYFDFNLNKPEVEKPVYTMELMNQPQKKKKPIAIQKPRPKKVKKKIVAKPKPKKFYKKPKPAKKLVTQKQKSPVKVVQASRPTQKAKDLLPEKFIPLPEKQESAQSKLVAKKDQSGMDTVSDGRFLRQRGGNPAPQYPVADRIRKQTGRVTVLGYVDRAGNVSRVQLDESSGTRRMETSAVQAFSNYKFQKGQEGWVKMPFEFTLDGEARVISVRNSRLLRSIQ